MVTKAIHNLLFKRTSTYALTILVGAFIFERGFDQVADYMFESHNKGKLWKDIKHKYE